MGNTMLLDACIVGNLENVKLAVSQGADVHVCDGAAVQLASLNEHLDVVQYLVSQGADIHAGNDYAVRWASEYGRLAIVKYLVSQSADIHACNDYALRLASEYGHLNVVRYLVSNGANIHADNDNAVQEASTNGHLDVVVYLASYGASTTNISEFQRRYATIYLKHYKRRETRAASRIYFWWIRRCYKMSRGSGIRMCLASLAEYEALVAL
jgi:hypothetical protein